MPDYIEQPGVSFGNDVAGPDSDGSNEFPTRSQFVSSDSVIVEQMVDGGMRFHAGWDEIVYGSVAAPISTDITIDIVRSTVIVAYIADTVTAIHTRLNCSSSKTLQVELYLQTTRNLTSSIEWGLSANSSSPWQGIRTPGTNNSTTPTLYVNPGISIWRYGFRYSPSQNIFYMTSATAQKFPVSYNIP